MLSPRPRGPKNWPWPWPRWQWPRPRSRDTMASASCSPASCSRLLQCTDFIFCRNNCQFQDNIGNFYCKASYHRFSGVPELYFIIIIIIIIILHYYYVICH